MNDQTTILASGDSWVLRRDGDGPAVLEARRTAIQLTATPSGNVVAIDVPPDLVARIVGGACIPDQQAVP